jgi:cation diffusion facilitator CzcD-associated flavoprotein CzcO
MAEIATSGASGEGIAIIGAGFAGLGMGIRLKQAGFDDFVIYEQAAGVGGTWRANHYPGAACDVQSHLYSFSFEPRPHWTRAYAPQAEILSYLEHCADKYGLRPHLRLNTAIVGAEFDEARSVWRLRTSDGQVREPRVLILGTGGLSRPAYPDIPGLSTFKGKVMHSARWDPDYALDGKTVAVIGTGASAVQIVPAIAGRVGRLQVYQRTPPWILPKPDHSISPRQHGLYQRAPWLQRLARWQLYWQAEVLALGFVVFPWLLRLARWPALWFLKRSVPDPKLREKLTPGYTLGCKRVLPSNEYLPALQLPNVELVTEGISEIREHGIATRDGKERPVDALILATGFQAAEAVAPFDIRGRGGRELNEVWREGAEAYLGTTVSGFPNAFIIVGPNTGLGHTSMILMIESQIQYIVSCLRLMRSQGLREVDVRPEAQATYNREIQARLAKSVWSTGGCMSWYMTRSGRNTTLWPGFTFEFRYRTRRFDPQSYQLAGEKPAASPAATTGAQP